MKETRQRTVNHKIENNQALSKADLRRLMDDSKKLTEVEEKHREEMNKVLEESKSLRKTIRDLESKIKENEAALGIAGDRLAFMKSTVEKIRDMTLEMASV